MDLHQLSEIPAWEWPDDVDKFLLEALRDASLDSSDRLLAVELAGEYSVVNDELAEALLAVARNRDLKDEVRGRAVISLGPALEHADTLGFEDPDDLLISQPVFDRLKSGLQELYHDPDSPKLVRRKVLEASVRAPQDWHDQAIRSAYEDQDADWNLTAVFCMRFISGFDREILEALQDEDIDIRYEAVCAAGNWSLAAAWPYVENIFKAEDADRFLILAAIETLPAIRPEAAGRYLTDYLDDEDDEIADAAMESMSMVDMLEELEAEEDEGEEDDDL